MQLSVGWFGNLDFTDWVRGLIAAIVSGGAGAVTGAFVVASNDPTKYAIGNAASLKLMVSLFAVNGLLAGMNFLRTKPLPDIKTVTTPVKTVEQKTDPKSTVVTTVKEVEVVPVTKQQSNES